MHTTEIYLKEEEKWQQNMFTYSQQKRWNKKQYHYGNVWSNHATAIEFQPDICISITHGWTCASVFVRILNWSILMTTNELNNRKNYTHIIKIEYAVT